MAVLRQRARMLRSAREFFARLDVLEVETPALSTSGVTDPNLASVGCRLASDPQTTFYLHTSPEYAMKRLLAAGSPDIYQICKVFRDRELGAYHQPEFTMIEWYRKDFDLDAMIEETCSLIAAMHETASAPARQIPAGPPVRRRYQDLFRSTTGLDPTFAGPEDLAQCAAELTGTLTPDFARQLGADRNAWLDFLMSQVVIPGLPQDRLVAVHHYPAEQAALARLDPADNRFAERFEIFFRGLELANGYRELLDPTEQRRRFDQDRARRAAAGLEDMPTDGALLAALDHGLPDCCGVAVGFDRVAMSVGGIPSIAEAISFGR